MSNSNIINNILVFLNQFVFNLLDVYFKIYKILNGKNKNQLGCMDII